MYPTARPFTIIDCFRTLHVLRLRRRIAGSAVGLLLGALAFTGVAPVLADEPPVGVVQNTATMDTSNVAKDDPSDFQAATDTVTIPIAPIANTVVSTSAPATNTALGAGTQATDDGDRN